MTNHQDTIEQKYQELLDIHNGVFEKTNKCRGVEGVLKYMLENEDKIWWFAWEFISRTTKDGDFLSHRAPARASDLAKHYPELVEDRKIGRYSVYRMRAENIIQIKDFLYGKKV